MRPKCSICALPIDQGIDGRPSMLCRACSRFECEECADTGLPILCGGKRTCEACHEGKGCSLGDADGCCVGCAREIDCQKMTHREQEVVKAEGLCVTCAMATAGGGA